MYSGWMGRVQNPVGNNIQPNLDNRYVQCRVSCTAGGWGGYKIHVGDNIQPNLDMYSVEFHVQPGDGEGTKSMLEIIFNRT